MPIFYYNSRLGINFTIIGLVCRDKGIESYLAINKKYTKQMIIHFPIQEQRRYKIREINIADYSPKIHPPKTDQEALKKSGLPWIGGDWVDHEEEGKDV